MTLSLIFSYKEHGGKMKKLYTLLLQTVRPLCTSGAGWSMAFLTAIAPPWAGHAGGPPGALWIVQGNSQDSASHPDVNLIHIVPCIRMTNL